jgi:hypothetical protein
MIYGLVIVTSLGAATLLDVYKDRNECVVQAGFIQHGPNSQAQCWPGKDLQSLKENIREINETVSRSTIIKK